MGIVFRLYINALARGNPVAVIFTLIWMTALSVGPFYEGVTKRDPAAIGLMGFVAFLCLVFLVILVVDRRLNPPGPKKHMAKTTKAVRSGRRGRDR